MDCVCLVAIDAESIHSPGHYLRPAGRRHFIIEDWHDSDLAIASARIAGSRFSPQRNSRSEKFKRTLGVDIFVVEVSSMEADLCQWFDRLHGSVCDCRVVVSAQLDAVWRSAGVE